jgi:hypothetical protein
VCPLHFDGYMLHMLFVSHAACALRPVGVKMQTNRCDAAIVHYNDYFCTADSGHAIAGQPPTAPFAHGMCRQCYDDYLAQVDVVTLRQSAAVSPPDRASGRKKGLLPHKLGAA